MPTVSLPIVSALTAGVLLLAQMWLLLLTVLMRRRARQSLGEGEDPRLQRAVRRHGNFAENAAIFVIGLALLEMTGAPRTTVEALAAGFVAGRLLHALGLSMNRTVNPLRFCGVVVTVAVAGVLGVLLILATAGRLFG